MLTHRQVSISMKLREDTAPEGVAQPGQVEGRVLSGVSGSPEAEWTPEKGLD